MSDYTKVLGDAVRRARIGMGMTQNHVADLIDVDVRTVLNIENHKGNPKLEVLYPLIRALRIDPSTIFYPEIESGRTDVAQFNRLLSLCTEEEVQALIPVCEAVLAVLRTAKSREELAHTAGK